jgi:hypothetical protein
VPRCANYISEKTARQLSQLSQGSQGSPSQKPGEGYAASNRETCLASQRSRPAGVRTPRASNSWAMALSVPAPVRWISAITARVVALALLACSDLAARALPIVSAPVGERA